MSTVCYVVGYGVMKDVTYVMSSPEMLKNTICYNKMAVIVTKNGILQNGSYCDVTGCDDTHRNVDSS